MRLVVLGMCALLAVGMLATTFLAIWSTRRAKASTAVFRQTWPRELAWAAIPCLMALAAAILAVVAIISTSTPH
jgi:hypothetical protein